MNNLYEHNPFLEELNKPLYENLMNIKTYTADDFPISDILFGKMRTWEKESRAKRFQHFMEEYKENSTNFNAFQEMNKSIHAADEAASVIEFLSKQKLDATKEKYVITILGKLEDIFRNARETQRLGVLLSLSHLLENSLKEAAFSLATVINETYFKKSELKQIYDFHYFLITNKLQDFTAHSQNIKVQLKNNGKLNFLEHNKVKEKSIALLFELYYKTIDAYLKEQDSLINDFKLKKQNKRDRRKERARHFWFTVLELIVVAGIIFVNEVVIKPRAHDLPFFVMWVPFIALTIFFYIFGSARKRWRKPSRLSIFFFLIAVFLLFFGSSREVVSHPQFARGYFAMIEDLVDMQRDEFVLGAIEFENYYHSNLWFEYLIQLIITSSYVISLYYLSSPKRVKQDVFITIIMTLLVWGAIIAYGLHFKFFALLYSSQPGIGKVISMLIVGLFFFAPLNFSWSYSIKIRPRIWVSIVSIYVFLAIVGVSVKLTYPETTFNLQLFLTLLYFLVISIASGIVGLLINSND